MDVLRTGKQSEISVPVQENSHYPVLIISLDCPFCPPAKNFWSKIGDELGADLRVLIAEKEQDLEAKYGISGYPCLVSGPDEKYYGLHYSHTEGKRILAATVANRKKDEE